MATNDKNPIRGVKERKCNVETNALIGEWYKKNYRHNKALKEKVAYILQKYNVGIMWVWPYCEESVEKSTETEQMMDEKCLLIYPVKLYNECEGLKSMPENLCDEKRVVEITKDWSS